MKSEKSPYFLPHPPPDARSRQTPAPEVFNFTEDDPPPNATRAKNGAYGLQEMSPRQYTIIPAEQALRARLAASAYKRRHPGWDYRSKILEDGSIKIWRIA